jgi:acetyl esterase/lipase
MDFARSTRWMVLLAGVASAVALQGCRITDMTLWKPDDGSWVHSCEVVTIKNVPYCDDAAGKDFRHRLDLYLPKDRVDFPVVVLVHGGAWVVGDNRCCGLYSSVGEFLASQGIGVAMPNYRLSPGVKHPDHVQDVAKAVAWTRSHIAEYGGDPTNFYLAGHSAGGHLVALLATDESYLKAEGVKTSDLKGVVAISGVYRIPTEKLQVQLGGSTPISFGWDVMAPLRGDNLRNGPFLAALPGIPVSLDVFTPAFGRDARTRDAASPVNHVRPGLPPFLIFSAEKDLPVLPEMAEEFHRALVDQGCDARLVRIENRNHNSIVFSAINTSDPVAQGILQFIRR